MKYSTAVLAFAATVLAQGQTGSTAASTSLEPEGDSGSGFTEFGPFTFAADPVDENVPGDNTTCNGTPKYPKYWLRDGSLIDQFGRTGSIVANQQYQFDGPPQAGAIYTKGFRITTDSLHITIGTNETFYRCDSGEIRNIYNAKIGEQCIEVYLSAYFCNDAARDCEVPPPQVQPGEPDVPPTPLEDAPVIKDCSGSPPPTSSAAERVVPSATSPAATASETHNDVFANMPAGPMPPAPSAPAPEQPAAPIVNATNPIATGTAAVPPSPTGATTAPSPFEGAGAIVAAGKQLVLAIAGVAAFALF